MLQRRSFKSSTNSSKRLSRRVNLTFASLKDLVKKTWPIIAVVVLFLSLNQLFIIRKINCSVGSSPCPEEAWSSIKKLQDKNSLFVNKKNLLAEMKQNYPVDDLKIEFKAFNTINISLIGANPYISANVYLVNEYPILSMDQAPDTTDSASWWIKPTSDLKEFLDSKEALNFNLWKNGLMTPTATMSSNINYIFSSKPSPEIVSSIYELVSLVSKMIDPTNIYIVNQRCFLSRDSQPDIIISVPFDEGSLSRALQSISYLATIKKDTKVIDLSFKNPIIR